MGSAAGTALRRPGTGLPRAGHTEPDTRPGNGVLVPVAQGAYPGSAALALGGSLRRQYGKAVDGPRTGLVGRCGKKCRSRRQGCRQGEDSIAARRGRLARPGFRRWRPRMRLGVRGPRKGSGPGQAEALRRQGRRKGRRHSRRHGRGGKRPRRRAVDPGAWLEARAYGRRLRVDEGRAAGVTRPEALRACDAPVSVLLQARR
jgi:hypothetical protein